MYVVNAINRYMSYYIEAKIPTVFIHIPKTAGRSVLTLIKDNYDYQIIPNDRTTNLNFHSTLEDAENIVNGVDPYVFSIVRNPWSRTASWFFFRREVLRQGLKALYAGKKTNKVQDNLDVVLEEYNTMLDSFEKWLTHYHNCKWDNTWFRLADSQSTWLKSKLISVDKVIKFENINEEIKNIELFKNMSFPLTNKGPSNSSYRELFTNSYTVDLIKSLYEEDIDTFGYTFS